MMTGGLIIKHKQPITNQQVLDILKRRVRTMPEPDTFENVMGSTFHGVAIAHKENITLVFGRDITHSVAFEQNEESKLNDRLENFPGQPEILVFLINTVSDTYALAFFENGACVAGKSVAEDVLLSNYNTGKDVFQQVIMNEDGILEHIKQFSGYYLPDLINDMETPVNAYIGS